MRMIVNIYLPLEPFNSYVRNGTAGEMIGRILDDTKPESIYFSEQHGKRGAIMVVDVPEPSSVPGIAEPWFLNFEASCEFRIAMSPDDLMNAGLDKIAEKWNSVPV